MKMYHTAKEALTLTLIFFICVQALLVPQNGQVERTISTNGSVSDLNLQQRSQTEKNFFFSNIGIIQHELLILLGTSSNTTTKTEIANYIEMPKTPADDNHWHTYASQSFQVIAQTTNNTVFNIANGIFVQEGVNLQPSYLSQVQSFYKAEIFNLSFANESSNAAEVINQYVSNHTEGQITNLFSKPLRTDTQVVQNTALYFHSNWQIPFSESATSDSIFNTGSENVVVKMMSNADSVEYGELETIDSKFIRLPFTDSGFEMMIFLPSNISTLERALGFYIRPVPKIYVYRSKRVHVNYKIPKMKLKNFLNFKKMSQESGVNEVFTDKADLSNMLNDTKIKISEAIDVGEIEINEKGINASIVEVSQLVPIGAEDSSAVELSKVVSKKVEEHPKSIDFIVDRPFFFIIRNNGVGTPLFSSAVYNPNEN